MSPRLLASILSLAVLVACADSEAANAPPDGVGTESAAAYDHYLAAQDFLERRLGQEDPDSAVARFEAAVSADPEFAEAWAGLAQSRMWLHFNRNVPGQVRPARQAADRAEELDPDGVETRLAQGYVAYWGNRDFDAALTEFLAAEQLAADDPDVAGAIGNIYRRQGRLEDAVRYYERRVELAPELEQGLATLAGTYGATGQYDAMAEVAERLLEMGDRRGQYWRFWSRFNAGDTAAAWSVIPDIATAEERETPAFFEVLQSAVRRNDAQILEMMQQMDLEDVGWGLQRELTQAIARANQADAHAEVIDLWIADRLDGLNLEQPSEAAQATREASRRSQAALLEALRGNRAAALEHAERVAELEPLEGDVWSGGGTVWNLAQTYLELGDRERALDLLEAMHARGLGSASGWMELHPTYDPIRGDSRFTTMVQARREMETAP